MTQQKIGPVGGHGGVSFDEYAIPAGARITEIRGRADDFIDSIQLVYKTSNGKSGELPKIGGNGGKPFSFKLAPDEYITGISGQHGWYIDSMTIHTNKRVSERFGGHYGHEAYDLQVPKGLGATGLTGKSDRYIDALGLVAGPVQQPSGGANPKSLQKIAGLGPKAAGLLVEEGIHSAEVLAKTSVEKLEQIFKQAGGRLANTKVASWPEQAMHAAQEDWKALKKLQEKLKSKK